MSKLSRTLQEVYDRERAAEEVRRANRPEWITPQMTVLKEIGAHLAAIQRMGLVGLVLLTALVVLVAVLAFAR